jgi:MYXO-CTERM domain-containing protein
MLHVRGRITLALCAALSTMGVGRAATAQIGSGWSAYNPPRTVQTRGCGQYAGGGVETFRLTCSTNSGDQRSEQRIRNEYRSGMRQFQGEVRVAALSGTNISIKQTFMPNVGPFLIIAVANNGRLYTVGDGGGGNMGTLQSGRWHRINTIHNVSAGTIGIYLDGSLRYTKRNARRDVNWHDKYGAYRTNSGRGTATIEWRNVRYFQGGGGAANDELVESNEPTLSFEAENLAVSSSEAAPATGSDVSFEATHPGSWMELLLPRVPAGQYMLRLNYRPGVNLGQVVARVVDAEGAEADIGGTVDLFSDQLDPAPASALLGNINITDDREHKVRLVVAGQNEGSEGFGVNADSLTLESPANAGDGGDPLTGGIEVFETDDQHAGFGCNVAGGTAGGAGAGLLLAVGLLLARRRRPLR